MVGATTFLTSENDAEALVLCECVLCCNGEHSGECRECAGWGDRLGYGEIEAVPCERCGGEGICPVCNGANLPDEEDW